MDSLKVLDCTLRDGGQGLEDLYKNGIDVRRFTVDNKVRISEEYEETSCY